MNLKQIDYRTISEGPLSVYEIDKIVEDFRFKQRRIDKLQKYYQNENLAIKAVEKDSSVPNNKIMHPFAKYITDTQTSYFMGKPVAYSAEADADQRMFDKIIKIFEYNDEQSENYLIAKDMSICGRGYELLYYDEDGMQRFCRVDPIDMVLVRETSIENNIVAAIRTYKYVLYDGDVVQYVEVYDKDTVRYYEKPDGGEMRLVDQVTHYWQDVPVVVYENNEESMGDFEAVLSLIDAYDKTQSNTANDMEQFTDAYLVLVGMLGTQPEDIERMKRDKIILLDQDSLASWLIKNVNDAWVENYKNRLQNDIHKFSNTPDMSDENFGNNSSGVSLRYKLLGMENVRATKERYFKKGLQKRIELLMNSINLKSSNFADVPDIKMTFNNVLPQNLLESAQIVQILSQYVSEETLLSILPIVEDPSAEIEKKQKEDEEKQKASYESITGMNYAGTVNTSFSPRQEDDEE